MSEMRSELSKKNKYWIGKHRMLELKHFCLQYPEWNIGISCINYFGCLEPDTPKSTELTDPTARTAEQLSFFRKRMEMVEQTAIAADPELAEWIILGVTQGLSYDNLKMKRDIPCCRDTYYDRYRKFFYLLDKVRE